jgi:hypothetical protein
MINMYVVLRDCSGDVYDLWAMDDNIPGYVKYQDEIFVFTDHESYTMDDGSEYCVYTLYGGLDLDDISDDTTKQ